MMSTTKKLAAKANKPTNGKKKENLLVGIKVAKRLRDKLSMLRQQEAMFVGARDEVIQSVLEENNIPQEDWARYQIDDTFSRLVFVDEPNS